MKKHRPPKDEGFKTGWPPGLLQDDSKRLHEWFASRIDARWALRKALEWITPAQRTAYKCTKHLKR